MEYENNKPNIEKKVKINSDPNVFDFKNKKLPLIRKKTHDNNKVSIKSINSNDLSQLDKSINTNSKYSINKSKSIMENKYVILPSPSNHKKKVSNLSDYSDTYFKFKKKGKKESTSINTNSIKFITLPNFKSPTYKKSSIKKDPRKYKKQNTMRLNYKKEENFRNKKDLNISIENSIEEINSLSDIQIDNLYSQINVDTDSEINSNESDNESSELSSNEENSDEMNNIKIPKEIKNGQNIYIVNQKTHHSLKDTIKRVSLIQRNINNYHNIISKNKINKLIVNDNINQKNEDKYKKTFIRKLTLSPKKKRKIQKKRTSQIHEIFIVSDNFLRKSRRESTQIIRPKTNILMYLNKEREAIKNTINYMFSITEDMLNDKKWNFLKNKVFPFIEHKTKKIDKKKLEEISHQESLKKLVGQIFTNFYQKIIIKNTLKELEISMVQILISFNPIKSINANKFYICNRFFDPYDYVLYYIFDAKLKERKFSSHRKSSLFHNNLKILEGKIVISPRLKKKNSLLTYKLSKSDLHFLNYLIFRDFLNIMTREEEIKIDFEAYPFLKRKRITKRKKRISIQDIIKIQKKKNSRPKNK